MTLNSYKYSFISVCVILAVTLAPMDGGSAGQYLDKLVHFAIFFLLAYVILKEVKEPNRQVYLLLMAILLGFLTEILQQFIPGRNLDFFDVLADTLGVVVAYLLYKFRRNQRKVS